MKSYKINRFALWASLGKKKKSVDEITEIIGCSRQTFYLWGQGKVSPNIQNLMRLCAALNIEDPNEIITKQTKEEPNGRSKRRTHA